MLSTVSSVALELNSSYYTTVVGNSGFDGFSVNESSNITNGNVWMLPPHIRTLSLIFCIVVMVLGLVGNLMVPLVVLRGKDMRNSTNIFLVNLSVADLFVLVICSPATLLEVYCGPAVWPLGENMCYATPFVELSVCHASVLTILAISFERYYAICEPLRAGYLCTKERATYLCLFAWVVAAVCTSPMIWVSQYRELRLNESRNDQEARNSIPVCLSLADTPLSIIYFLLLVLVFYILPLLLLLVLYSLIVSRLTRESPTTMDSGNTSDAYHSRARRQVVLMLITVVLAFFVCLSPYRILMVYILLTPAEDIAALDPEMYLNVLNFTRIMFYLNSAINPILYNLMSSRFRKGFLALLCGARRRRSTENNASLRSTFVARRAANVEQQEHFL